MQLICLLIAGALAPSCALQAAEIRVSTKEELARALGEAKGGETILLAPANYGSVVLTARFNTPLRLRSEKPSAPAHFDSLRLERAQGLYLSNLDFGGSPSPLRAPLLSVADCDDVQIGRSAFRGDGDGDPTNDREGAIVRASRNVTVEHSSFRELRRGVAASFSSDVKINNNNIQNMGEDGLDFAQVNGLIVSNNSIGKFSKIVAGYHPDAIQFMTAGTKSSSKNILIEGNEIIQADGVPMQGIFMGNENGIPYMNVKIVNNLVYTQQYHGISVADADQVQIDNNTVVSKSGDRPFSWILINKVSAAEIRRNVAEAVVVRNSPAPQMEGNWEVKDGSGRRRKIAGLRLGVSARASDFVVESVGFQPSLRAR